MDDPPASDADFSPGAPPRSLWSSAPAGHSGAARLADAAFRLDAGDPGGSATAAREARAVGLPAELLPHAYVIEAAALLQAGDPRGAMQVLVEGWSSYPDVAAIPALLGTAQSLAGDGDAGARSLLAAIVSEDPDGSLETHRRLLTAALTLLHRRAETND